MKVGVDARALLAGRGVARFTRGLLAALAEGHGDDEWLAFVPGRARHFLHDMRRNRGMPSTVDTRPFSVGGNLAVSPGHVIHRTEVFELIQYAPTTPTTRTRPLIAIPPQINKYYATDLAPGRSLVEGEYATSPSRRTRGAAGARAARRAARRGRAPGVDGGPSAAPTRDPAAATGRYLLFVGARDPRKGLDVATAAHERARARGLDAELVVVGDGLRRVDDAELAALYAGAVAVVAPSYLEGFGLVALEAAAHGTPAVVSDLLLRRDAGRRRAAGGGRRRRRARRRAAAHRRATTRCAPAWAPPRASAPPYTWERAAAALHPLLAQAAA
jgi:glycosyltransferase involved in cell wall biosynthesis